MDWVKNIQKILAYTTRKSILSLKEHNSLVLLLFKTTVNNGIKF